MYEYEVEGESAVSEYEVPVGLAMSTPARYTRYPVTAVLSREAVQERLIWVVEKGVAVRLIGVVGAVVSVTVLLTVTLTPVEVV